MIATENITANCNLLKFLFQLTGVTCYTCKSSSSNASCNMKAVDRPCPGEADICLTIHQMAEKKSINSGLIHFFTASVEKKCVSKIECQREQGCKTVKGNGRKCGSCCTRSYCNEEIPWHEEDIRRISMNEAQWKTTNRLSMCIPLLLHYAFG